MNDANLYLCPVCGFDALEVPPYEGEICPSCGTEFGLTDEHTDHATLRHAWAMRGAPWWGRPSRRPLHWQPLEQLLNVGHEATPEEHAAILRAYATESNRKAA